jgi:hypothetical protein
MVAADEAQLEKLRRQREEAEGERRRALRATAPVG